MPAVADEWEGRGRALARPGRLPPSLITAVAARVGGSPPGHRTLGKSRARPDGRLSHALTADDDRARRLAAPTMLSQVHDGAAVRAKPAPRRGSGSVTRVNRRRNDSPNERRNPKGTVGQDSGSLADAAQAPGLRVDPDTCAPDARFTSSAGGRGAERRRPSWPCRCERIPKEPAPGQRGSSTGP